MIFYVSEFDDRKQAKEDQQKAKHYQAWQVISSAYSKPGSGGRIDALQDLNNDGVSLGFIDVSGANLTMVKLPGARLSEANLQGASLGGANLQGANLGGANLQGANLGGANLQGANLGGANLQGASFDGANLQGADLRDILNWKEIKSINSANIYGVIDAPEGFIKWAKKNGAFSRPTVKPLPNNR